MITRRLSDTVNVGVAKAIVGTMRRPNDFFRSLKHEQLNYEKFKTQEAAKLSVVDYLAFYNGRRSRSTFSYQSPINLSGNFIETLPKQVYGFCWSLQVSLAY